MFEPANTYFNSIGNNGTLYTCHLTPQRKPALPLELVMPGRSWVRLAQL